MNKYKKQILICFVFLFFTGSVSAQNLLNDFLSPAPTYDAKRVGTVLITEGVLLSATMIGLHYLWYKGFPRSKLHLYNDNAEWLQMDKVGHATATYNIGVLGIDLMRWTGMNQRTATLWGGITGLLFLTTVEFFDGFSSEWGFSPGDMIANTAGSALAITQNLAWNEQRIQMKFSFHQSIYAEYRPNVLGENYIQRLLKDYNGQTYWLSGNMASFLNKNTDVPKWLNIAVGYGAEGMLGGYSNPATINGHAAPQFERSRRLLLSLDMNLPNTQPDSKLTNFTFNALNFIKIPAPVIEYKFVPQKLSFHPLYF